MKSIAIFVTTTESEKFGDVGAVATLWSLTVARVVAITTSTASIGMGWFDMTVFPYRSCTEATIS